jgi:hypothetical protein
MIVEVRSGTFEHQSGTEITTAQGQGNRISLTGSSFEGICGGAGDPPPCGLGDVSENQKKYFNPGTEVTVFYQQPCHFQSLLSARK